MCFSVYMLFALKLTYETKYDYYFLKVCYEYVAEQGKELYELVIRIYLEVCIFLNL